MNSNVLVPLLLFAVRKILRLVVKNSVAITIFAVHVAGMQLFDWISAVDSTTASISDTQLISDWIVTTHEGKVNLHACTCYN